MAGHWLNRRKDFGAYRWQAIDKYIIYSFLIRFSGLIAKKKDENMNVCFDLIVVLLA